MPPSPPKPILPASLADQLQLPAPPAPPIAITINVAPGATVNLVLPAGSKSPTDAL